MIFCNKTLDIGLITYYNSFNIKIKLNMNSKGAIGKMKYTYSALNFIRFNI